MVKIKVKKLHPNAVIPKYAKDGDAGMDLTATTSVRDNYGNIGYGTGIAVEIPKGYVGYIFPRSSISKYKMNLTNSVGVIDSGYRGEIIFKFKPTSEVDDVRYNVGDRVGQLIVMPYPEMSMEQVEELTTTDRGDGGFGSSGK